MPGAIQLPGILFLLRAVCKYGLGPLSVVTAYPHLHLQVAGITGKLVRHGVGVHKVCNGIAGKAGKVAYQVRGIAGVHIFLAFALIKNLLEFIGVLGPFIKELSYSRNGTIEWRRWLPQEGALINSPVLDRVLLVSGKAAGTQGKFS